ncbi:MAG: sugar ABC transporter substrate-binding protein [Oscillospiraceae bacterium]|jgi:putative chitobiose transport system substrate-binding protein|nr:sugar ABC transporter substrate-binding protein [Oscillospiraceae bacterium]
MLKRILTATLCCVLLVSTMGLSALAADEPITLEFWTVSLQPTFTDFINGIVAEYETAHPGVKIEWVDLPWDGYQEKLVTSISAGDPPDVVNLWDTLSLKEATADVLVNLNEEATPEQLGIYSEAVLAANDVDGGLYGFPWYASVPVTVYNKELLAQAGFDAPPKTYAEMLQMAPIFKEKTGAYLYLPMGLYAEIHGTVEVISNDETTATFNTPELVQMITTLQTGVNEDWLPRGGWNDWNEAIKMYAQGSLGMISANAQSVARIENEAPDKYAVSAIAFPMLYDRGFAYTSNYYLLIPKGSKHHAEAIDFANFVTNDKNQLAFCKLAAIFPTTKEAPKDPFFTADTETPVGQARAMAAQVAASPYVVCIDAVNVRFDDINHELGVLEDEVIADPSADVAAGIAKVEAAVNAILAEEQAAKKSQ